MTVTTTVAGVFQPPDGAAGTVTQETLGITLNGIAVVPSLLVRERLV
jgi:hypothetical protein